MRRSGSTGAIINRFIIVIDIDVILPIKIFIIETFVTDSDNKRSYVSVNLKIINKFVK